ncbi:response regulator [Azospirillum brasilense]|nr:response regulator [Azospirillum brasilense]
MARDDVDTLARPASGARPSSRLEWRHRCGPAVQADRNDSTRRDAPAAIRPLRLLIVEDESLAAEAVGMAAMDLGHIVCGTARTEEEAVAIAGRERPDVALMDVRLAGGDGIEAARRLRTNYGIRSIFLSGYANHAIMARITETYPLGVVNKPYSLAQLKLALDLAARRLHGPRG